MGTSLTYRRRATSVIPILLLLAITFAADGAFGIPIQGSLSGTVTDRDGTPLPGTTISLPRVERRTMANGDGQFTIEGVGAGTYVAVFQLVGYLPATRSVVIGEGDRVSLRVELDASPFDLPAVTVTGTPYASDPLATSPDIDVLAGEDKIRRQATNVGASVAALPGVASIATGTGAGKPVIRGLSGNRVRVLADGIGVDFQQYGIRHWENIDPVSSERIEVVRGASSVLYGSDAIGGVINVVPLSVPCASDGASFAGARVLSRYASNNGEWLGGLVGEGAVGGFGFTGSIARRSAGNLTVPDVATASETGIGTDPKFTGELDHTDFDQINGSIGVGYHTGIGLFAANYTAWRDEHNFLLPNGAGIGQKLKNDVLQIKSALSVGGGFVVTPTLSYVRNLRQSNSAGSTRDRLPDDITIDLLISTYTGRVEVRHPAIGRFGGQVGAEYVHQQHDTRASQPLVPDATVSNLAGFAYEEGTFGDLRLSLGARFDYRTCESDPNSMLRLPDVVAGETDDVLEQEYISLGGSAGAIYSLMEQLSLAANVGRGFRAPSIFELHAYGEHGGVAAFQIGDPELDPETSLSTDLSLRWSSPRIQAKATVYRNAIANYIYLANTGEIDEGSSLPIMKAEQGDAVLVGGDISAQAQVFTWLQVRGCYEVVRGELSETNDELPLLPADALEGEVRLTRPRLWHLRDAYLGMGVRHVAAKDAAGRYEPFWQFDANPSFGLASTDSYTTCRLSMGAAVPVAGGQRATLDIAVENLFDTDYRDFLDTYKGYALSPGRSVVLSLSVPVSASWRSSSTGG